MPDFLRDSLIVGAVEVDLAGGAHHHTHRTERSCAGDPQLRRTSDVTNIGLSPEHRMSRSYASIWANARSRRPIRNARVSGRTSVAIRGVGVVGDRCVAVLGDHDDFLTAVAACPVLPHDGFKHQDHAWWKDKVVIELLTEVRSIMGARRGKYRCHGPGRNAATTACVHRWQLSPPVPNHPTSHRLW